MEFYSNDDTKFDLESDQKVFNQQIQCNSSNKTESTPNSIFLPCILSNKIPINIVNVSRLYFHTFPQLPQPWQQMGLPNGDEELQVSQIVHFAGVYGGISIENGHPNYIATLIAIKGFIDRHIKFLGTIPYMNKSSKRRNTTNLLDIDEANWLMKNVSIFMSYCIQDTFTGVMIEVAEKKAKECLKVVKEKVSQLLTPSTKKIIFDCHHTAAYF